MVQTRSAESRDSGTREMRTECSGTLKIVPRKLTDKMIIAAIEAHERGKRSYSEQWDAMLSAVPEMANDALVALRSHSALVEALKLAHDHLAANGYEFVDGSRHPVLLEIDAALALSGAGGPLSTHPSVCGAASFCESSLNPSSLNQSESSTA